MDTDRRTTFAYVTRWVKSPQPEPSARSGTPG
jgi:hypothetical protein